MSVIVVNEDLFDIDSVWKHALILEMLKVNPSYWMVIVSDIGHIFVLSFKKEKKTFLNLPKLHSEQVYIFKQAFFGW